MNPADRQAQLLAAARRVFAESGYHKAGVSDIIREAGVARGTFYNYFDSKSAVFHAVLDALTTELAGAVTPIDIFQPIVPQARNNVASVIEAVMCPDVVRLLFSEAVGVDEEADAVVRAFYAQAEDRLVRALETGQALGVVRAGSNLRVTARCILGMVKEPVFLASLRGETLDPNDLVEELTALLTSGILRMPDEG